jgi:hypothetical protein
MKRIKNLKCFFGKHAWWMDGYNTTRTCMHCGKIQRASYDPMYGSTNWR